MSYRSEGTFELVIYESEYRQIQAWTNKHQNLETGGDLFGLWQDDRTAVVQLVVGPGKQCRRRSTSFYQDVDYLKRMGDVLTSEEGLCHIGEWHSHHTLGLSKPSEGDESTIWSNMDRYGLSRFVLFIANIDTTWSWSRLSFLPNDETTVNGFLFEVDRSIDGRYQHRRRLPVLQAEFIFLQEENPFRSKYLNAIREGAESLNSVQDLLRVVVKKYQQMESGWNKVLQENKKLETSLAAEQKARKETDKRLHSSEKQTCRLRESLAAQTQAREETERRLHSITQQTYQLQLSLAAQTQAREEAERRLHSITQQTYQLQLSLAAQTQAREEAERRLHSSEQQTYQLQSFLAAQTQAREEAKSRLNHNEQGSRLRELETSLVAERQERKELEATLDEEQKAHEETRKSRDWMLERNEITLSDTIMREGEWGCVVEGSFYECKVAVKVVQRHNLQRLDLSFFEREMKKAFQCRHPCILQFIGMTCDDQSLLFVSELPDTSLSAVIHERSLQASEITTIALDVAKGLNYLHLKCPAIVHGDISSANVLLWKKVAAGCGQAKISDCCTIDFLQQSMTNVTFDSIYAAPEAQTSKSPKVDVFSFGVLLWEMNIREQPDVMYRNQQIRKVLNQQHRMLIRKCLGEDPETRPCMQEIIEKIKKIL